MCVGERALAGLTDGLYSEAVAAGLDQPLHLVGVAGAVVNGHEPARETVGEEGGSGVGEETRHWEKGVNKIKKKVSKSNGTENRGCDLESGLKTLNRSNEG